MKKIVILFCILLSSSVFAQDDDCDFAVKIESSDWINVIGELDACHDFDLTAVTNDPQNDASTTFEWTFGFDSTSRAIDQFFLSDEQSFTHQFSQIGEYPIRVRATDANGCVSDDSVKVVFDNPGVETSLKLPENLNVCANDTLILLPDVSDADSITNFFQPISWASVMSAQFEGGIYLPDGEGVSYETEFNVAGYAPSSTISMNDTVKVCVNIEHSWLGDLEMSLISPNDKEVRLFDNMDADVGEFYLGDPVDEDFENDSIYAGTCWQYCWTVDAENGVITNSLDNVADNSDGKNNSLKPGIYEPEGDFSDFIGSTVNGVWRLKITDNLAKDNGFICGWQLSIDMEQEAELMSPKILSYQWDCLEEPSSILYADSTRLEIKPTTSGLHTYKMTITDNHGCDYEKEFQLDVYTEPVVSSRGATLCDEDVMLVGDRFINRDSVLWTLISKPEGAEGYFFPRSNWPTPRFIRSDFGTYELMFSDLICGTSETFEVEFTQKVPTVVYEPLVRDELETDLKVTSWGMEEQWAVINGPGNADILQESALETSVKESEYGDYTLSYTGCDTTVAFNILFMGDLTISNVITPNDDGVNDELIIDGLTDEFYAYSNMSIFNRWGDEVYRNGSYGIDGSWWSGTSTHQNDELNEGLYFYVLKLGNKVTMSEESYQGTIHLYR